MLKPMLNAIAVTLLSTSAAHTEIIRIDFHGTVETIAGADGVVVSDYIGSGIAVGTPYSGHYIFDSEAQDLGLGLVPNRAVYQFTESPFEMVVEMGGFIFRSNPSNRFLLLTASNDVPPLGGTPGGDEYTVSSTKDEVVVGSNGLRDFRPEMVLQLLGGNAVRDGVTLLLTPEQHQAYTSATLSIQGIDPTNQDDTFVIQSGDVVFSFVPEPSALILVLTLLPCVLRRRRRR